jgi:hypothetical protein
MVKFFILQRKLRQSLKNKSGLAEYGSTPGFFPEYHSVSFLVCRSLRSLNVMATKYHRTS